MLLLDGPAVTGALSVGTSAVEAKVGGSVLSDRKAIAVQPLDFDIYWGYDSGVTTSTGHLLYKGTLAYIQSAESLPIYFIAAQTTDVRLSEIA